jgi:predicted DsbA family dithiol-disulfide isomerase
MSIDTNLVPVQSRLRIDVWGDVVCPWCYVGDARLERAITESGHAEQIDLVFHTFELDPSASHDVIANSEYVAKKYRMGLPQVEELETDLRKIAAVEGLLFEVNRSLSNTHDILRVIQYASTQGKGWRYMKAVQRNIFHGRPDAFSDDSVVATAEGLGLDGTEVRAVLRDKDRLAREVQHDRRDAIALGANGVPFTVLDDKIGIPGAASLASYASAVSSAWDNRET